MKYYIIALFVCISSCSVSDSSSPKEREVLEETKDNHGRIVRRVTTGYIPGEDLYLSIEKFDSAKNVVSEYGAKPYGVKFRIDYKYDHKNRIVNEKYYDFGNTEFEHYSGGEYKYSLDDTLADFDSDSISKEVCIFYSDQINKKYTKVLSVFKDSISGKDAYHINTYITLINSK